MLGFCAQTCYWQWGMSAPSEVLQAGCTQALVWTCRGDVSNFRFLNVTVSSLSSVCIMPMLQKGHTEFFLWLWTEKNAGSLWSHRVRALACFSVGMWIILINTLGSLRQCLQLTFSMYECVHMCTHVHHIPEGLILSLFAKLRQAMT